MSIEDVKFINASIVPTAASLRAHHLIPFSHQPGQERPSLSKSSDLADANVLSHATYPSAVAINSENDIGKVIGASQTKAFSHKLQVSFKEGVYLATNAFSIPHGQRLVIDKAVFFGKLPLNQKMSAEIQMRSNGRQVKQPLGLLKEGLLFQAELFAARRQMRLFADPETAVVLALRRSAPEGIGSSFLFVYGFLVSET